MYKVIPANAGDLGMVNRQEIGSRGEVRGIIYLRSQGFIIEKVGTKYSAYDVLARRDDLYLAINIKAGKNFMVRSNNLKRLVAMSGITYIPALLFDVGEYFQLFILANSITSSNSKIFKPLNTEAVIKMTKVGPKGATQLPPEIREQLGIEIGDKVVWETEDNNFYIRRAV